MLVIMQMWNKYRNHLLAWYWQNMCWLDVVPNVMFSDEDSWQWVFDGMPQNSTICISNVSVMQNKEWTRSEPQSGNTNRRFRRHLPPYVAFAT